MEAACDIRHIAAAGILTRTFIVSRRAGVLCRINGMDLHTCAFIPTVCCLQGSAFFTFNLILIGWRLVLRRLQAVVDLLPAAVLHVMHRCAVDRRRKTVVRMFKHLHAGRSLCHIFFHLCTVY